MIDEQVIPFLVPREEPTWIGIRLLARHSLFQDNICLFSSPNLFSFLSMKNILALLILCSFSEVYSQNFVNYDSRYETIFSKQALDSFPVDIHIPNSFEYSSDSVEYPLIILLDNQSEFTHRHNLNSVDILTMHDQMPAAIIVGIGFNMGNRRYFTSMSTRKGDSLSGVERTSRFIFDELIPRMEDDYKANGPILIIGHSRTAYLTSYFLITRNDQFDAAGPATDSFDA